MACTMCRLPLENHYDALRALGELPFDIVKSIFQYQWHKDVVRIIYAHAQYYHDECLFSDSLRHDQQMRCIDDDIKSHQAKYITHYLHAIIKAYRHEGVGPTTITMENEISVRVELKRVLVYELPDKLDDIFRQAKPFALEEAMPLEKSMQSLNEIRSRTEFDNRMFGQGCVQRALDYQVLTVISIVVQLSGEELISKVPDLMWCWNQPTEHIQEYLRKAKLDLF